MPAFDISIKYVAPMYRLRVKEPDGSISVYGGRSVEEVRGKLHASRDSLIEILRTKGEVVPEWEEDLRLEVDAKCRQLVS